jgi:hypothetical protein
MWDIDHACIDIIELFQRVYGNISNHKDDKEKGYKLYGIFHKEEVEYSLIFLRYAEIVDDDWSKGEVDYESFLMI